MLDSARPRWDISPYGVVSLLTMLEFAARDFMEISHTFGIVLGEFRKLASKDPYVLGNSISQLLIHAGKLGLSVTEEHIISLIEELCKEHPENIKRYTETHEPVFSGQLDQERTLYHIETLYRTMLAEIGSMLFKTIPRDRILYCDPKWLADTQIPDKFPVPFRELQRAGNCYALGEPTACVFHSMRALEKGLHALAKEVGVNFPDRPVEYKNWGVIIPNVESKIEVLQKSSKGATEIERLKFLSEAAVQFTYFKDAWRNHVTHTRESYSDKEASSIMLHSHQFIESLCSRLGEPR